jgi:hypothetical protein
MSLQIVDSVEHFAKLLACLDICQPRRGSVDMLFVIGVVDCKDGVKARKEVRRKRSVEYQ